MASLISTSYLWTNQWMMTASHPYIPLLSRVVFLRIWALCFKR